MLSDMQRRLCRQPEQVEIAKSEGMTACCRPPLILPFFHSGVAEILPKGSVLPRPGMQHPPLIRFASVVVIPIVEAHPLIPILGQHNR